VKVSSTSAGEARVQWQGNLIQKLAEAVQPNVDVTGLTKDDRTAPDNKIMKQLKVNFGRTADVTRDMAKLAGVEMKPEAQLTLTADNVFHLLTRHGEDKETKKDQRPLTTLDLEMLPYVWRNPEGVEKGDIPGTLKLYKLIDGVMRLITLTQDKGGSWIPTSLVAKK